MQSVQSRKVLCRMAMTGELAARTPLDDEKKDERSLQVLNNSKIANKR